MKRIVRQIFILVLCGIFVLLHFKTVNAAVLKAGVAKINITNLEADGSITDSLYVKALVLDNGSTRAVIITVDAVVVDEERISKNYLSNVRLQLQKDLNIEPSNVMFNASHLHGIGYNVTPDIEKRTIQAVKKAAANMVPVKVGAGSGYEDRITQNHILKLTNGKGWAIRHANPLPPDEEIESVGPIDPEIGILRLDKKNGETLAIVYNFTGHPYQSVTEETAGFPGFASRIIENSLSEGTIALFIQGFCGDVIPILYKDVHSTRDQEPLGTMLGLSAMEAINNIKTVEGGDLKVVREIVKFPRRFDFQERIASLQEEQESLLQSLPGTSLNFKTFLPLFIKYNLNEKYPSYYSHRYLNDKMHKRHDMEKLDAENRRNLDKYMRNIHAMEKLTRLQFNISLLKDRKAKNEAAGEKTIDIEIQALKIGDFILVTFPAEVSVQVGLNIKEMSPFANTFVAGYTNGSISYTPTSEQFGGGSYQDHASILTAEWQNIYEKKVMEILKKL